MDILKKSLELLEEYPLCDNCLGRQFALLSTGTTNKERGSSIKMALTLQANEDQKQTKAKMKKSLARLELLASNGQFSPAKKSLLVIDNKYKNEEKMCYICDNVFPKLQETGIKTIENINNAGIEFSDFLVGSKLVQEYIEKEDILREKFELSYGESMKKEINREFGKILSDITGKDVNFDNPNVIFLIHIPGLTTTWEISSLFISGWYLKYKRGIPQTRWPCSKCRGKGCKRCNNTGLLYPESVEQLVAKEPLKIFEATGDRFHAAGREDIDVRMLGTGRPFVLELMSPKKRVFDLKLLEKKINKSTRRKVKIKELAFSTKKVVRRIKLQSSESHKTYKAKIILKEAINLEQVQKLDKELSGTILNQRTPIRVSHRRADLIRKKKIYNIDTKMINNKKIESTITCQGGLYVKELISGDNGRTQPSYTKFFNTPAKCSSLDVLEVKVDMEQN
ncbi:MAG: tRNA pseudouridine(54/55) synthase Pus10 [Candidatus Ranarchaeia archaeon]